MDYWFEGDTLVNRELGLGERHICAFCGRKAVDGFDSCELIEGGTVYACADDRKCHARRMSRLESQWRRERDWERGRPSRASAAMALAVLVMLLCVFAS